MNAAGKAGRSGKQQQGQNSPNLGPALLTTPACLACSIHATWGQPFSGTLYIMAGLDSRPTWIAVSACFTLLEPCYTGPEINLCNRFGDICLPGPAWVVLITFCKHLFLAQCTPPMPAYFEKRFKRLLNTYSIWVPSIPIGQSRRPGNRSSSFRASRSISRSDGICKKNVPVHVAGEQ